jgi:hypothetical protein
MEKHSAETKENYTNTQKRAFTKWCNFQLMRSARPSPLQSEQPGLVPQDAVHDILADLRDGVKLLRLLESISGEALPKPEGVEYASTAGSEPAIQVRMRIHRMLNVDKALRFLENKTNLKLSGMNIGSEDIVDGNEKITLGLIWLIILRFQIQKINDDKVSCELSRPRGKTATHIPSPPPYCLGKLGE